MIAINRRKFLKGAGFLVMSAAGNVFLDNNGLAHAARTGQKSLSFRSLHTSENINVTYWANGEYEPNALREIDHIMRDWRTGEVFPIDTALLDLLFDLRLKLGTRKPYRIVSGFRSLSTNAALARRSSRVARRSLHMAGMAIDMSLSGVDIRSILDAALSLRRGGVGFYPKSDFVHLDTGRVRRW